MGIKIDFLLLRANLIPQTPRRKRIRPVCRVIRHTEIDLVQTMRNRFDGTRRSGCPEDSPKPLELPAGIAVDHPALFGSEAIDDGILHRFSRDSLPLVIIK